MANTVTINRSLGIINIIPDGSTDFDLVTYFPEYSGYGGVLLDSIGFKASNAADVLRVAQGTDAGVDIMPPLSATSNLNPYQFHDDRLYKPYIDVSECTFTTPANVFIVIKFQPGITGM